MTKTRSNTSLKLVNFISGFALLVMLFPVAGKLPEKPAGVRTAIDLIAKKQQALRACPTAIALA